MSETPEKSRKYIHEMHDVEPGEPDYKKSSYSVDEMDRIQGKKRNYSYPQQDVCLTAEYRDNQIDGVWKFYDAHGNKRKLSVLTFFEKGKRNGPFWRDFYGSKEEGYHVNDRLDGVIVSTHKDGHLAEIGEYYRGVPRDVHQSWYSNHQMKSQIRYNDNGKPIEITEWHSNGQKKKDVFIRGNVHKIKTYFVNGELCGDHTKVAGKNHGWSTTYRRDKTVVERIFFINGKSVSNPTAAERASAFMTPQNKDFQTIRTRPETYSTR